MLLQAEKSDSHMHISLQFIFSSGRFPDETDAIIQRLKIGEPFVFEFMEGGG